MRGLAVLAVLGTALLSDAAEVSPIQKVLQMMDELKAKALKGKQDEIVEFTKFSQFCQDTEKETSASMANAETQIFQLQADILKYDSDSKVLGEEITALDSTIAVTEEDKSEAMSIREKEKADYMKTHEDYVESIADLVQGTTRLKQMMSSVKAASAASLLQTLATKPHMPDHAKQVLAAFLTMSTGDELGAPAGPVYESQAGGVVDLMKDLQKKLEGEKTALEQEEIKANSNYEMVLQTLTGQITSQKQSLELKATTKKSMEESSAKAAGDLGQNKNMLAEDTSYLKDLKMSCAAKARDFESRQVLRAEELVAVNKAIEIMSSSAVSLVQVRAQTHGSTALAQLRSSQLQPSQARVASFLTSQGKRLNSNVLAALALRVSDDPMGKVKKMIQDMVYKLMEEATEESEHKGFCDKEMGTNLNTRNEKSSQVEQLKALIEKNTADASLLAEELSELSDEIVALDAAVSEATSTRAEEKQKNVATIADAQEAIAAVSSATKVLKDFYDKASTATALVQKAAHSKPFTGSGGEGGILGMLEVILSDFQRLETETAASETTSAAEYESFMKDSSKNKAVKLTDSKHKANEKVELESDTAAAKKDLKSTQEELDAALEYFEKLKPSCVQAGQSYEERVAQRNEEIESLKDALSILDGN